MSAEREQWDALTTCGKAFESGQGRFLRRCGKRRGHEDECGPVASFPAEFPPEPQKVDWESCERCDNGWHVNAEANAYVKCADCSYWEDCPSSSERPPNERQIEVTDRTVRWDRLATMTIEDVDDVLGLIRLDINEKRFAARADPLRIKP